MSELTSFGFKAGDVLGAQTMNTSGTITYLDCSALLPSTGSAVLGVEAAEDFYMTWTASNAPATTPTKTATSGAACMLRRPKDQMRFYTVTKANPFLGYTADSTSGVIRVVKRSG